MHHHVTWHGTRAESFALIQAVAGNCACTFDNRNRRQSICAAHDMLVSDQRALDGLVFARHVADRLRAEEHGLAARA